jgi:hypothetical protein
MNGAVPVRSNAFAQQHVEIAPMRAELFALAQQKAAFARKFP